jgi:cation diffusion facilitator CzcD-associated flavoprotein CzcO
VRIAIVGTGFGGIGMAAQLKANGYRDITLFERGSEVGGVWSANTYPGAACDVPSQLYSLSFAPNLRWSGNYPPQAEIRAYVERVAENFGVTPLIRFRTTVRAAAWQGDHWTVTLEPGGTEDFDVLISAVGQLSTPVLPAIPGLDTFAGTSFHSAWWDHDADLDGKRIGVVGTGASAIQFVPRLADRASELVLFQRSAPYVMAKHEVRFNRGPVRDAFGRVAALQRLSRGLTYVALESRALGFVRDPRLLRVVVNNTAKLLAEQVPDPVKREALRPTETPGCKRILVSNDYYPAVARDTTRLVTSAVREVTRTGVITADGEEHRLDVIVYGTGFAANEFLAGLEITGEDGVDLHERWTAAEGAESFRGGTVAGFPNLVLLYGPNTNLGHNSILYMLESQFRHVLRLLEAMTDRDAVSVQPRPDRQYAWNSWVSERMERTAFAAGCHSWYANARGKHTNNWPSWTPAFRRSLSTLDPTDFEFSR